MAAPVRTRRRVTAHTVLVAAFAAALLLLFAVYAARGFAYYHLPLPQRPFHPLHRQLRPAGPVGIDFGVFSTLLFGAIFLYPVRKRWAWLRRRGTTRHWLDFHIVMGLMAPLLVALHSAFKFGGLAGAAYWIMLAVVASGIVGRYLYAQIPRSRKDAELTLKELEQMRAAFSEELACQNLVAEADWRPLATPAHRAEVLRMPLPKALWRMLALDVKRPFQMMALRRHGLSRRERVLTLGGLLASGHADLERIIALARRQSWLTAKICFLDRAGRIFRMWHVIHRPFSYAFLALLALHIGLATWMGFF